MLTLLLSKCLKAVTHVGSPRGSGLRLEMKMKTRRYVSKMVRVALWAILVTVVAYFLSYYLDTPVPHEIPEKWKVKILDGSMRTYGHLVSTFQHCF